MQWRLEIPYKIRKISRCRPRSVKDAQLSHLMLLFNFQRTAKKCTRIYNARAQPLFCSLNLLFDDVLVAVAVVVCLSSLILYIVTVLETHPGRGCLTTFYAGGSTPW